VVFRQLPEGLEDLVGAFKEASDRNRKPDPLAIALLTIKIAQSEVQVLHHDLHYAEQDPETMPAWLKRAQRHFADKPEADLVEAVKQAHRECKTAGKFSGEIFPDTCVDVEGTLFDSNGVFRPDVLARAVTEANGQPITIWTGGDLVAVRKMLRDARVPYKLVPKELMAGATVGNVIDDMPEAEFRETYGIHYGHYTQIAP
jgi:hypothetical protein